jgi:hypothetical protein
VIDLSRYVLYTPHYLIYDDDEIGQSRILGTEDKNFCKNTTERTQKINGKYFINTHTHTHNSLSMKVFGPLNPSFIKQHIRTAVNVITNPPFTKHETIKFDAW